MMLTAERLREILDYDPDTGVFTWRIRRGGPAQAGRQAGSLDSNGYRQIMVDCHLYLAHRLAWLHVRGVWPSGEIDHRNGTPDDNRIDNLRTATRSGNMHNQHRPQRNNRSGFLGVSPGGGRWRSVIRVDGRLRHLGYFDTPEEASAVYVAAKRDLHPFWHESVSRG